MVTSYNVISEDGFIARKDDSEDFIPDELWTTTLNLFKNYDVVVMGRKTYEIIQKYPKEFREPFEQLPLKKVVMTRNKDFIPESGYMVCHSSEDIFKYGENILVTSGPTFNTFLLEEKLIDKVIFHQVPVSIQEGIKAFNIETKNIFVQVSEIELENGVKEFVYQVVK